MKKILTSVMVILCAVAFALAQDSGEAGSKTSAPAIGLGARLAVGYGMIWGLEDDWSGGENDDNPGGIDLELGAVGRYEISSLIHFTPELLFRYANYSQDDDLGEREFEQMNLEVPLLVRANATPKIYAYVGPKLGVNLKSDVSLKAVVKNKGTSGSTTVSVPEKVEQSTFGFGMVVGAGYYVLDKLGVDFRVGLGLTELYPDSKGRFVDLGGAKDLTFKLGANYWVF